MAYPEIMIYGWNFADSAFAEALKAIGIPYSIFSNPISDYHADGEFARELIDLIIKKNSQAVFSYDYFPILSMICEIRHIPYITWIYDCPVYTMQSESLKNEYNYIFCFDRFYAERLKKKGARNCFHFPLAGRSRLRTDIEKAQKLNLQLKERYSCEISFVGSLYNDFKNRLRYFKLNSYSAGYIEGVVQAQLLVYGYNFIKEAISERIAEEIIDRCQLSLGNMYGQEDLQMAADAIGLLVTNRERENVLQCLSDRYTVHVYSNSEFPDSLQKTNILQKGCVDYATEMPYVFYNSCINLNITSRTIESGIPLRVFDILSSGGFCLTNYQPEIAEFFSDGEELVMYTDMADMVQKVDYYLNHEKERNLICQKGYEKIKKEFELEDRVREMLSIVFGKV